MNAIESPLADTLLFLPGASGDTQFWKPVSDGLKHPGRRTFMTWPGFGGAPLDDDVTGVEDLVTRLVGRMTGPVDLLAQSMGGVVAIRAALERPRLVKHLVLSVTSGGLDVASLGAADWRPMYRDAYAGAPPWFIDDRQDLSSRLREILVPVLLLWGDADPISPVAVAQRLTTLFPRAELVVIKNGTHDLVRDRASDVIPHITRHLAV